ncbi:phosphopantetheine-binding protein [endosymbiont of Lamellibrachia barhami]|uniref:phosphopantetheine-binding protein n=1 Tax=endosymbiont of Lamellibrachia barhami TaxID=205975 RepID=UPI00272A34D7|nr:phosphopantetheine-binding protein [endosymbiont of Lamellibrachia barhami]
MENEVATLIIETLNLRVDPSSIDPQAPLFNEGLGLDSIDALELAMSISKKYGFQLRSNDEKNANIFASLSSLSRHIESCRTT